MADISIMIKDMRDTFQLKQWMLSLFLTLYFNLVTDPPQVRFCDFILYYLVFINQKQLAENRKTIETAGILLSYRYTGLDAT